jgi:hypothetical protein
MSADKYLNSINRIIVLLLLLSAAGIAIFMDGIFKAKNDSKGMAAIFVKSVYDALPTFNFERHATNRDILAIYAKYCRLDGGAW